MKRALATIVEPGAACAPPTIRQDGGAAAFAELPADALDTFLMVRQAYLDALPIAAAVLTTDLAGQVIVAGANPAFTRILTGLQRRATPSFLSQQPFAAAIAAALAGEAGASAQFDWNTGDGAGARHFTVRLGTLPVIDGIAPRCLLSLIDRTAEVESARSLRAEMLHDSLTGLPNRVAFDEALEAAASAGEGEHAVLVVNLARFSRINECMGSMAGDELIITVARRLVSTLRAGDVLARIGGDEFGILMRVTDSADESLEAARRIVATLTEPFRLSDLEIRIDCAVGCASLRDGTGFVEDVVRNAQFACKRAKRTSGVELYQPGEATAVRRRFAIETELRRAIENEKLTLAYQPLVDLASGRVTGFEALARWTHEDQGPVSPAEFIPVAEECGLIVPLGRWAMDRAVATLKDWDRTAGRPLPLSVAVNLSSIQLVRDDVVGMVADTLGRHALPGDRLKIELTESVIVHEHVRAAQVLHALKGLRCTIAMDDFGTGYSNLAYLQKLPIDVLKIDRSFVTDMLADRDKVAIVRAVLGLAHALGMKTTAEGVETAALAHTLSALGCTQGQGYHFGRPMPADEALACFRASMATMGEG